ncbi:GAP family protein [Nocardioides panacis]|uniref:GAP family protein n=1 Tax=Nocardioides panacis TaxID=2849501 RepID=A0A975Y1V9_9ACTN|nr:GAP family protein [Nocardioides panacis]QWZ09814.1 GAP family protein [Nocardioides panacis]
MALIVPVLLLGLLASLSPSTLVVFLLLLETTRARVNAGTFLVGWVVSLTVVFVASYELGAFDPLHRGTAGTVVDAVEVALGLVLVALAVRQWRRRHRPHPGGGSKRWEGRLEGLGPWEAAVLGVLEQPWTLTAAAAVVVVQHQSARLVAAVAFVVFAVVSTAGVGSIYAYYALRPGEARTRLAELRARVVRAGPTLVAGVTALVGVVLVADGLSGRGGP